MKINKTDRNNDTDYNGNINDSIYNSAVIYRKDAFDNCTIDNANERNDTEYDYDNNENI